MVLLVTISFKFLFTCFWLLFICLLGMLTFNYQPQLPFSLHSFLPPFLPPFSHACSRAWSDGRSGRTRVRTEGRRTCARPCGLAYGGRARRCAKRSCHSREMDSWMVSRLYEYDSGPSGGTSCSTVCCTRDSRRQMPFLLGRLLACCRRQPLDNWQLPQLWPRALKIQQF